MAKKTKSKKNQRNTPHAVVSNTSRQVSYRRHGPHRYTGKYLTLAIMGSAVFFMFKGCSDSSEADNDGDGTFYSTVQDCIDDGNDAGVCSDGWNNAKTEFYAALPKQMSQQSCQSQFGNCYLDNVDQSWIPVVSGFLLSRAIRKGSDDQYTYSSGGSSYVSRPVWRTTTGDFAWRSGSGNSDTAAHHGYSTRKASTISRGGYGHSSSARGHWGG